jgi:hypothetical protein
VRGSVGWVLEEAGVGGGVERTGELAGGKDGSGELGAVGDGCWGGGDKWRGGVTGEAGRGGDDDADDWTRGTRWIGSDSVGIRVVGVGSAAAGLDVWFEYGNECSSNTTWRDMMILLEERSKQR